MTDFPIPDAALAQHTAVLGKTGSGKTTTAKGIVEHLVAQGARVCILDPIKSDWWGLTSSADGKRAGLPFHILGGPRGHVQLHAGSGKAIAEIVANGTLPLSIIDMADFVPGGQSRFFIDFAPTLLRKMRGVVHLVMEEAHLFAPKERSGVGDENMAIHWAKMLATAGRSKGVRLILVTQRTQALHNAMLGSCETMIAHRLTAPADQKPLIDWLKANTAKDVVEKVSGSLAALKTGTAWVCSGEAKFFEQIHFPKIKTYDNSATPTGAMGSEEVRTAPVDVDHLRAIVGEAAKEAEANDPKVLRAEIAKLKVEISKKVIPSVAPVNKEHAEKAYNEGFEHGRTAGFQQARNAGIEAARPNIVEATRQVGEIINSLAGIKMPDSPKSTENITKIIPVAAQTYRHVAIGEYAGPTKNRAPRSNADDRPLGAERRPLASLASVYPSGMTEAQWAVAAGLKRSGGTWGTYVSRLRMAGRIERRGDLYFATESGVADLGDKAPTMPPPGEQLVEFWAGKISGVGPMLRFLASRYPEKVSRDVLAAELNMAESGGTFGTYISRLRAPGLIEVDREGLSASDALMVGQ